MVTGQPVGQKNDKRGILKVIGRVLSRSGGRVECSLNISRLITAE